MSFANILQQILKEQREKLIKSDLDICFCIDTTGSMGGWIQVCKENIIRIIENLQHNFMIKTLRIAVMAYKDFPITANKYITLGHDFKDLSDKKNVDALNKFIKELEPSGGGDCPECVCTAFRDVVRLNWNNKAAKAMVFFTDAPPHGVAGGDTYPNGDLSDANWIEQTKILKEMSVTCHTIVCGGHLDSKRVLEKIANMTGGSSITLEPRFIQEIIVGAGEDAIDKNRLATIVLKKIKENIKILSETESEFEKVDHLMKLLAGEKVYRRKLIGFWMDQRWINRDDLMEIISYLRSIEGLVAEQFPTFGNRKESLGLYYEKKESEEENAKNITLRHSLENAKIKSDVYGNIAVVNVEYEFTVCEDCDGIFEFPELVNSSCIDFTAKDENGDGVTFTKEVKNAFDINDKFSLPEIREGRVLLKFSGLKEKSKVLISAKYIQKLDCAGERIVLNIPSFLVPLQKCSLEYGIAYHFPVKFVKTPKCDVNTENYVLIGNLENKYFENDLVVEVIPKDKTVCVEFPSGFSFCSLAEYNTPIEKTKMNVFVLFQGGNGAAHNVVETKDILEKISKEIKKSPKEVKYNVYKFNSIPERLLNESTTCNDVKEFENLIKKEIDFKFGSHLLHLFESTDEVNKWEKGVKIRKSSENTAVILIGNGNIPNSKKVIDLLNKYHSNISVFSIGVGKNEEVNEIFFKEISKKTGGNYEKYDGKDEKFVERLFNRIYCGFKPYQTKNKIQQKLFNGERFNCVFFDKLNEKFEITGKDERKKKCVVTIQVPKEKMKLNELNDHIDKIFKM